MTVTTDDERLALGRRPPDYYRCTCCGRVVGKDNLRSKRAVFKTLGAGGQQIKSTTTAWLCIVPQDDGSPSCLEKDPDFQAEPLKGTPGSRGTRLA
jgi:hypothetical protein